MFGNISRTINPYNEYTVYKIGDIVTHNNMSKILTETDPDLWVKFAPYNRHIDLTDKEIDELLKDRYNISHVELKAMLKDHHPERLL